MPVWSDCLSIFGQMRPIQPIWGIIQPALCSLLQCWYQCSHPWSVDDERCVKPELILRLAVFLAAHCRQTPPCPEKALYTMCLVQRSAHSHLKQEVCKCVVEEEVEPWLAQSWVEKRATVKTSSQLVQIQRCGKYTPAMDTKCGFNASLIPNA